MRCCQWQGVGPSTDAADGLIMAQNYSKVVQLMASGWPASRCCQWPPDRPETLQSSATGHFELTQPLSKAVMGQSDAIGCTSRRPGPDRGLYYNDFGMTLHSL